MTTCFNCEQESSQGRKEIRCNDGATVSIQASCQAYCAPQCCDGPLYLQVEAGYPSVDPPAKWMEFCENPAEPKETVYAFMPFGLVWGFVRAHGGLTADSGLLDFIPKEAIR